LASVRQPRAEINPEGGKTFDRMTEFSEFKNLRKVSLPVFQF
jgi:hypothetical protein